MKLERITFICECHSLDHQLSFWYDEEDKILYCEPHLTTYRGFFKRCWRALGYILGRKSRYGDWDSMIFKPHDLKELQEFLKTHTQSK